MEEESFESYPCYCVGPQGTDKHCPCKMRELGLEPSKPTKDMEKYFKEKTVKQKSSF